MMLSVLYLKRILLCKRLRDYHLLASSGPVNDIIQPLIDSFAPQSGRERCAYARREGLMALVNNVSTDTFWMQNLHKYPNKCPKSVT